MLLFCFNANQASRRWKWGLRTPLITVWGSPYWVVCYLYSIPEQKGKYKQTVWGYELKELPSARYLSSLAATHVVATTLCITLLMLPTRPTGLNHGFRTERTVLIYQFLHIVTVLQKCTFNGAHSDWCWHISICSIFYFPHNLRFFCSAQFGFRYLQQ